MAQAAIAELSLPRRTTPATLRRRWLWIAVAALLIVYVTLIAMNWPFTQQAVIKALQARSLRTVTIGHFYRTYFPPGCTAQNIRFLHRTHKEKKPLVTVEKLVLVTSYSRVLTFHRRLSLVRVTGMHVTVPPGEPGQRNPVMPLTYSKSGPAIKIDRMIADGTVLDFVSRTGQSPYRLTVDKLRLDGIGDNLPMSYRTVISNQMPPGKIRSTGVFGTWNTKDPGSTPLHGVYTFENANLAAIGGVSGTLASSGNFTGRLREITVQGTADVPHFKVHGASHERQLAVAYRAIVDGTSGDTKLEQVTARFDGTTAGFKGAVSKSGNSDGKTASIDMWTDSGRIEDVLRLFISERTAPIEGAFTFAGHVDLPPGPEPFLRRVKLSGNFGVAGGKFASASTERDLTRLSNSSASKSHANTRQEPDANVLSDLKGYGSTKDGVARLSNLTFAIPGAQAWMHGTYGLTDSKLDLHGKLLTTGNPSDATTGFKSLMMKVVTPFFKKGHKSKVVPFKITGAFSKVNLSLDLERPK